MAISQIQDSETSPVSSKHKSKLTQRKTWDAKRKLVKKRLAGLTHATKNEGSENLDMPIICNQAKAETSSSRHNCTGVSTSAMERAQEVQANLLPKFPNFSKLMLRSHVSGGFWLGLPKQFCDVHLPKHDETIVLVGENEQEYDTKYLVGKNGLSGGWRGFSLAHKLIEGDVLVFQLIQPCKFKIYIMKESRFSELDGAIGLLTLNCHDKSTGAVKMDEQCAKVVRISEAKKQKYQDPLAVDNQQENTVTVLISDNEVSTDRSGNNTDNSGSEIMEGIKFSESIVNFKDVKDFKDFIIQVDGLILDSEIATHLRKKYYELCRSQNMFLHEKLIYGLNIKLTTGIISETVNIADAIRAIKATTSLNDLESWNKTLKAFEDLGMAVGFLRGRIHEVLTLSREYQDVIDSKRSKKAEAQDKMRCLKEKLLEVEASINSLAVEIDTLEVKKEGLGFALRNLARTLW